MNTAALRDVFRFVRTQFVCDGLHPGLSSKHQVFLAFYPKFANLLDEDIV